MTLLVGSSDPYVPERIYRAQYTLVTKSTVAETGDKLATESTVADMVDFVAGFGDKSATT